MVERAEPYTGLKLLFAMRRNECRKLGEAGHRAGKKQGKKIKGIQDMSHSAGHSGRHSSNQIPNGDTSKHSLNHAKTSKMVTRREGRGEAANKGNTRDKEHHQESQRKILA